MAQSTMSGVGIQHSGSGNLQIGRDLNIGVQEDDRCLSDLYVTNPRDDKARIEKMKGGLLQGASHWILGHQDFQRWRNDPDCRLLWIKGDPGKGKTMLLCGIIDELEASRPDNHLISYFFCQATDIRLNNATAVLRSLIYMLVTQNRSLSKHIQHEHKDGGVKLFEGPNVWYTLSRIFAAILKDPDLQDAHFFIDALDECQDDLTKLLDLINQYSAAERHKWIVSSRNIDGIERGLRTSESRTRLSLELKANAEHVNHAVDTYISHHVYQLAQNWNDKSLQDYAQETLQTKAQGTYLWAALVVQELQNTSRRHVKTVLQEVPAGLGELYGRMMQQIEQLKRDRDDCLKLLATILIAYRPLHLEELGLLFDSPLDITVISEDIIEIVKMCGSFLTLRDNTVYFVHQSAKDYLIKAASSQLFPAGPTPVHHKIYSKSIDGMSKVLQRDIYGLSHPGTGMHEVTRPDPDPLVAVRYSCVYWVDHLTAGEPVEDIKDDGTVQQFLQQKYLYWLEALSLLHNESAGVHSIFKLSQFFKGNYGKVSQLTELISDALRFVQSYNVIIAEYPLQAYEAALLYSPTRSIIRMLFRREEPRWLTLKPKVEENWSACIQILEGHTGPVYSVAFSPDLQLVASGSHDHTVRLWSVITGECLQILKGHTGPIGSVVFSPDSQLVASGSHDHTVRLWSVITGECFQIIKGHTGWVNPVVFSPDSQLVASGFHDHTVRLWSAVTGKCLQILEGHTDTIYSAVFSPDSQLIASGSSDFTVRLWSAITVERHQVLDEQLQVLEGHTSWVNRVVFSPDSQLVASGSCDNTVRLWSAATGECLQVLEGHTNMICSVVFSPDSQVIASGSDDHTVRLWSAVTGECLQELEGYTGSDNVSFDKSGKCLIINDGSISIEHLSGVTVSNQSISTQNAVSNPKPDSACIYTLGLRVKESWVTLNGKSLLWLPVGFRPTHSRSFEVFGNTVALGCESGRVIILRLSEGWESHVNWPI